MSKGLFAETGHKVSMDELNNENLAPGVPETATISTEVEESATPVKETINTPLDTVKTEAEKITSQPASTEVGFDGVQKFFETKYGQKIESEDYLKGVIESASKVASFDETQKNLSDLKEKYELLLNYADPKSHFTSEEAAKVEQFKRQFPDKDSSIANQIFSAKDLKSVSDFDIVKWGYKLDFPGMKGNEDDLRSTIAEDLSVDPTLEVDEWPVPAQNRLLKKAFEYRKTFEQLKAIELPKSIDVESLRQQMKSDSEKLTKTLQDGWTKATPEITNDAKTLKIQLNDPKEGEQPVYFEWDLGDSLKGEVETIVSGMIANGATPDEASLPSVKEAVQMASFWKNKDKIIAAIVKDRESRKELDHLNATNNTNPLKDEERTGTASDKQKAELNKYLHEDDNKFKSRKLFK
jgi:hypothetical protein